MYCALPRPQCGFVPPAKYLVFRHAFIYIHFPVLCEPSLSAGGENPTKLPPQFYLKLFFNFSHKRPMFVFTGESGYTLGFAQRIAHSDPHAETGGVSDGALSLPSTRTARSRTSPGRVPERRALPLLGLGRGCSQRTQRAFGTAMRLCASLSRGVAAPLGCVIFFAFVEIAACTPCAQSFPRVQGGERYHYPRRALHVLETLDGRLSKRLVCRFLRSMGIAPRATPIFLRIYRYPCR